ncbi:MAG: 30S ribosomal protein S6 [bacterium]|nr:30S ribosomal protein S6 [bacterium]
MRKYETMFILSTDFSRDQITETVERFKAIITNNGGQIDKAVEWGKRRLAYEVKKQREGFYVLINFTAEPGVEKELERVFNINEGVIRYLIIRLEE